MGRKIPAKKHRGVKDPLVQQARREQSLKSKINAPPKDPDDQPVPRSLTRLFSFQENREVGKRNKKNKVKRLDQNAEHRSRNKSSVGRNPITCMKKLPGESGRDFSLRINSALKALHNPVENLDYPEDIDTEDTKGERMAAQRERRARKRKKAKKGQEDSEPQLNRNQRLAQKKKEKKMKALDAASEKCEVVYEHVPFGELAHAPPALRRHGRLGPAPNAGGRALLLSGLLAGAARREAVAAYRTLKASRPRDNKLVL
ncbi:UPF0653 protein C607.02c [Bombyx mandarina]|uniref:Coiled-coil domain-containing protein 137 n=2 Tax=Bombyx TaxID=7090 RepID=A0A8R2AN02_BOMMO|nr:UPF0653 protein C607.02c isoform X1 [Bombyx mori]XP_028037512.1 UPF0653 protein C607.02c [Bombyx mandarina]